MFAGQLFTTTDSYGRLAKLSVFQGRAGAACGEWWPVNGRSWGTNGRLNGRFTDSFRPTVRSLKGPEMRGGAMT